MAKKQMKYEEAMARLNEIVSALERGDASLEDSLAMFEEGAGLLRRCETLLAQAEQKVTKLTLTEDGAKEERFLPEEAENGI